MKRDLKDSIVLSRLFLGLLFRRATAKEGLTVARHESLRCAVVNFTFLHTLASVTLYLSEASASCPCLPPRLCSRSECSRRRVPGNLALTCRCPTPPPPTTHPQPLTPVSFHFLLPHILYQYLPDPKRPALKMKERNFTLCQKKEWKLRAVSDN